MKFLWPEALVLMVALPLLVALYVWLLGRRKKAALRYASLSLVRDAIGAGSRMRRHLPPLLLLVALTLALVAIARPTAVVTLPSQHDLVVLAMDISRSMLAEDVKPNRITAAQEAARTFIAEQPRNTRVAIVSFAGTAQLVQPPTHNKEDLLAAIDRFQLQRATAIGSAIVVSLSTIFPDAGIDLAAVNARRGGGAGAMSLDRPPLNDGAKATVVYYYDNGKRKCVENYAGPNTFVIDDTCKVAGWVSNPSATAAVVGGAVVAALLLGGGNDDNGPPVSAGAR